MRYTILIIFCFSLLTACGTNPLTNGENPYSHYEDDKMIGKVWEVSGNSVEVDISEWVKRNRKGPNQTDEGYSYMANLTKETAIKFEDGKEASIEDMKKGQKVLVNPPSEGSFEGTPEEIILLEMTYEEKYARLLSHVDGYNLDVMFEEGSILPSELQETLYEKIRELADEEVVATWMVYDEEYVVDYKEELGIGEFPVMLVFDREKLIFKANDVEELYEFFED
ncbi:hypothetical protein AB685_08600 [Bacillus sp. LL01]|uniref:hypothetical protein n=1 Tax=Bacillus sp. LL01 TaxID=1665556 RepID=UPI00064CE11C|nr:hypothetical protein [Bacillus sp. LL01]KMJ59112.1 hypothetical protein AB685_08600 [Bacillus sp. LL01]